MIQLPAVDTFAQQGYPLYDGLYQQASMLYSRISAHSSMDQYDKICDWFQRLFSNSTFLMQLQLLGGRISCFLPRQNTIIVF